MVAAACVCAIAIVAWQLGKPAPEGTQQRSPSPAHTEVAPSQRQGTPDAAQGASRRRAEPAPVAGGTLERARAHAQARRFLRAFVGYQAGASAERSRRAFTGTATRELSGELLDTPPRGGDRRSARARPGRLRLYGPWGNRAKASVVLRYRRQVPSLFEFVLTKRRGVWRASSLYP